MTDSESVADAAKANGCCAGMSTELVVTMVVLALSEASRGVVIPVLSPLIDSLGGSAFALSMAIALFSVGRGVSSNVYGWLIDRNRHSLRDRSRDPNAGADTLSVPSSGARDNDSGRSPLALALLVTVIGHSMFLISVSGVQLWLLLLSRALTGFGTGVLTIARTLVADASAPHDRVRYNAWLGIVAYAGGALTPIVGTANVAFGSGPTRVTNYAFGSFLLLVLSAVAFAPVLLWAMRVDTRQMRRCLFACWTYDAAERRHSTTHTCTVPLCSNPQHNTTASSDDAPSTGAISLQPLPSLEGTREGAAAVTAVLPDPADAHVALALDGHLTAASASDAPVVDAPAIRRHRLAVWTLIVCNGLTRGTVGVAETYGAQVYAFATGALNHGDLERDVGWFFLILGAIGLAVFVACDAIAKRCGEFCTLAFGLIALTAGFAVMIDFHTDLPPARMWLGMLLVWSVGQSLVQTLVVSLFSKHVTALNRALSTCGSAAGDVQQMGVWMGRITSAGSWGRIITPILTGAVFGPIGHGGIFAIATGLQLAMLVPVLLWRRKLAAPRPTDHSEANAPVISITTLHTASLRPPLAPAAQL